MACPAAWQRLGQSHGLAHARPEPCNWPGWSRPGSIKARRFQRRHRRDSGFHLVYYDRSIHYYSCIRYAGVGCRDAAPFGGHLVHCDRSIHYYSCIHYDGVGCPDAAPFGGHLVHCDRSIHYYSCIKPRGWKEVHEKLFNWIYRGSRCK
ncbi:MAG: hypothetical protein KGJ88_13635 [Verrucomicrobiota bacterium]|nr:hypothetical protein [Verrucomicrobiota bacterium]